MLWEKSIFALNKYHVLQTTCSVQTVQNLQLVRTVDWLCYSISVLQVGGHLKGVDVHVWGLAQGHQLPQAHTKCPLRKRTNQQDMMTKTTQRRGSRERGREREEGRGEEGTKSVERFIKRGKER